MVKKYGLFDKLYDREFDAWSRLGTACLASLQSPVKTHYPLSK